MCLTGKTTKQTETLCRYIYRKSQTSILTKLVIFEVFSKILWKIITYYLYIHRITYCPHLTSHFSNSFNWRMFMNLDSDIGSFLKNIMENNYILYIYIYIFRITHCIGSALKILWKIIIYYLYIFRITYCPRFSSLFPN